MKPIRMVVTSITSMSWLARSANGGLKTTRIMTGLPGGTPTKQCYRNLKDLR